MFSGRARAEDSSYEVVTGGSLGAKKAQKENLNKIRERMMILAIEEVKKWPKEKYEKYILEFQTKYSKERSISALVRKKKKAEGSLRGPYAIICRWCTKSLCSTSELRLLAGTHHSVLSDAFKEKYITMDVKPKVIDDDLEFRGNILCKNCCQKINRNRDRGSKEEKSGLRKHSPFTFLLIPSK